jgi:hypothetical protein
VEELGTRVAALGGRVLALGGHFFDRSSGSRPS